MNSNIANNNYTGKDKQTKNHQAYAMEASRLKFAKQDCLNNENCDEFNRLGGEERFMEVNPIVKIPRTNDEIRRKSQEETNPNNTHRDEKSATEVSTPNVTKGANHKKANDINIITNSQALNEEISAIKYLIEYMNNNKKQKL